MPKATHKPDKEQITKRGWVLDSVVMVGHMEAELCHIDERISDLNEQVENSVDDLDKAQKMADEIATLNELHASIYEARVKAMNDIFSSVPGSNDKYYCLLKHAAMAYIVACENAHARKGSTAAYESAISASQTLATVCSLAFGFEPFSCIRCLSDRLNAGDNTHAKKDNVI